MLFRSGNDRTKPCGCCGVVRALRDLDIHRKVTECLPEKLDKMTKHPSFTRHRKTDPETSVEAARSVAMRESQQEVLKVLSRSQQPLTDQEIYNAVIDRYGVVTSPSGCRTRRSELVDMGFVKASGTFGTTVSGRRSIKWEVCSGS